MQHKIEITRAGFGPPIPGPVHPGDSVWFVNLEQVERNANADNGWLETPNLQPGQSWGIWCRFPRGDIRYHDRYYTHLTGILRLE